MRQETALTIMVIVAVIMDCIYVYIFTVDWKKNKKLNRRQ